MVASDNFKPMTKIEEAKKKMWLILEEVRLGHLSQTEAISQIYQLFEPKSIPPASTTNVALGIDEPEPDESRLLSDGEVDKIYENWGIWQIATDLAGLMIKAQLAKDLKFEQEWQADFTDKMAIKYEKRVAELEANCQARVERIKREIGKKLRNRFGVLNRFWEWWQEFWKQEGIG